VNQVLQEAAAARHILLICGSAEIDGHVFGLGVKKLNDCFAYLDSRDRTHLVTELIRDASFRSTCATNYLGEVSLDIRPLSELIDMFSTHEATDPRDKVYALLGMSSDDPEEARLLPDYEIGLAEFFQRLVQFLLSTKITADTCGKGINPVIKSKGCVLGKVVSITDMGHDIVAHVSFNCKVTYVGHQKEMYCDWTLQTSAKPARKGDIVCLLEGALKPTIIRTCKDHFTVISIAATPPEEIRWAGQGNPMEPLDWPALLSLFEVFGRDFRLIWDWEGSSGDIQNRKESESTIKEPDQSIGLEDDLERMNRLLNVAQILEDVKDYEGAENRYQEAIKGYKKAVGETHPQTLIAMDSLARLYKKGEQWDKTRSLLIEIFKLTKRARGAESQETLRKKDLVESLYRHQWAQVKTVDEEEMVRLLKQILDDALLPEDDLLKIFKSFDVDAIGLLLQQNEDEDWITEDVMQVAAPERKGHRFEVTEAVFKAAVGNRDNAVDVIKLLLEQRGDAITVTNELIETMVKEWIFSPEVIKEFPHNISNKVIE
jgi:tetratricopeptide (TPR) repeat protein